MDKHERTAFRLAKVALDVRYENLPDPVKVKAKELILDSLACQVGGIPTIQGEKIINLYGRMGGTPEASVFGTDQVLPLLNAVYVNAYLATVLDFDDTYDGHPGSTVVPPALSLGQQLGISGQQLLEAVVAGYEVGLRVSNGIKATPERIKKVRGINTWQIFCSAAVGARMYGLDLEETAGALSHAAIHASVPTLRKWGFIDGRIQELKNNFGYTSYGGVLSAMLAKEGFVSDTTIFDGEDGFWIMASSDQCHWEALRQPLDEYHLLKVHTKPYTACRHIHPTLDAATQIAELNHPDPESVDVIEVETFYEVVNDYSFLPSAPFDVVFSAPFLVSLVLHQIPPGPSWLGAGHLARESIMNLARKVTVTEWEEASRLYPLVNRELMSRVRVRMKNGQIWEQEIRIPKGDPRNPMTEEDLKAKFDQTAGAVLGSKRAAQVAALILGDLEELDDIRTLANLLQP